MLFFTPSHYGTTSPPSCLRFSPALSLCCLRSFNREKNRLSSDDGTIGTTPSDKVRRGPSFTDRLRRGRILAASPLPASRSKRANKIGESFFDRSASGRCSSPPNCHPSPLAWHNPCSPMHVVGASILPLMSRSMEEDQCQKGKGHTGL